MYTRILVAVDLSESSAPILEKAKSVADRFGASLRLLHVIEYIPIDPMEPLGDAMLPAVEIEQGLMKSAEQQLAELAEQHELSAAPRSVECGSIKGEIVRVAAEQDCELVVLGSHERHGLGILVNATEDAVLHKAQCDVLAVRIS